LALEAVH